MCIVLNIIQKKKQNKTYVYLYMYVYAMKEKKIKKELRKKLEGKKNNKISFYNCIDFLFKKKKEEINKKHFSLNNNNL